MFKKSEKANTNVNEGVALILRGAKKRRSMALAAAKRISADIGFIPKLVAIK